MCRYLFIFVLQDLMSRHSTHVGTSVGVAVVLVGISCCLVFVSNVTFGYKYAARYFCTREINPYSDPTVCRLLATGCVDPLSGVDLNQAVWGKRSRYSLIFSSVKCRCCLLYMCLSEGQFTLRTATSTIRVRRLFFTIIEDFCAFRDVPDLYELY